MKSITIVLAILTIIVSVTSTSAFADHSEVTIETAANNLASPGCLETETGCYTPNTTTVDVGGVVIMTNTDEYGMHTFTSGTVDGFAATPDYTFDSGIIQFGNSFEYTAETVGEFPYYCMLHTWMQGVLIVQETEHEESGDHEDEEHGTSGDHEDEELMVTITDSIGITKPRRHLSSHAFREQVRQQSTTKRRTEPRSQHPDCLCHWLIPPRAGRPSESRQ